MEAGLDVMTQLTQAKAAERLANVDQMLEQGVISEEEAEKKKEKIKKDAARKQQKIDIVQALINTAKADNFNLKIVHYPHNKILEI